jgi:signal transduction histidine kinase
MGLAIVRKIAETQGGRAWVESEPGHGACFKVLLPSA